MSEEPAVEMLSKIGARIAYYRRLRDLKQIDLAMEVGISEQYLSRIERGHQPKGLTIYTLLKIAEKLDVNMRDFIDETE